MREELNDSITKTVVNFVTQLHETEDEFILRQLVRFAQIYYIEGYPRKN